MTVTYDDVFFFLKIFFSKFWKIENPKNCKIEKLKKLKKLKLKKKRRRRTSSYVVNVFFQTWR
jgi:hypothetical protein